jgi:ribosomal protein S18 acetylase RimI-like enzyme
MMIISTAVDPRGVAASSEALRAVIPALAGQENPYAILSGSDPMTFMQALWTPTGHVVEYQEGSVGRHYRTVHRELSAEDVIAAFQSYASGESAWRTMFDYQRVEVGSRGYHAGHAIGRAWGGFKAGYAQARAAHRGPGLIRRIARAPAAWFRRTPPTELVIRETRESDIESLFHVRARTRDNPIPREQLAAAGITPASSAAALRSGDQKGWVCLDGSAVIGFCSADGVGGEVIVLAVLPEYEGRGVGKRLLAHAVDWLRARGAGRVWLAASPDPAIRAHGFYRSQGWRPTGERVGNGDEILVLDDPRSAVGSLLHPPAHPGTHG